MKVRRGEIEVYLAAALWSTIGPVSLGDPLSAGVLRLAFAGLSSSPFFKLSMDIAILGTIIFPFYTSYAFSVNEVGVTLAVALLYTAPAWVSLVEKLRGRGSLLPAAISSLGVYLLTGAPKLKGKFFVALLPGLLYAAHILYSKELLKRRKPEELLGGNVYAAIMALPLLLSIKPSLKTLLAGAYLGVVCSTIAYLLFYKGLREVDAWYASVAATLEPALAALWGHLLGEELPLLAWIGFGLILTSQFIAHWYENKLTKNF